MSAAEGDACVTVTRARGWPYWVAAVYIAVARHDGVLTWRRSYMVGEDTRSVDRAEGAAREFAAKNPKVPYLPNIRHGTPVR